MGKGGAKGGAQKDKGTKVAKVAKGATLSSSSSSSNSKSQPSVLQQISNAQQISATNAIVLPKQNIPLKKAIPLKNAKSMSIGPTVSIPTVATEGIPKKSRLSRKKAAKLASDNTNQRVDFRFNHFSYKYETALEKNSCLVCSAQTYSRCYRCKVPLCSNVVRNFDELEVAFNAGVIDLDFRSMLKDCFLVYHTCTRIKYTPNSDINTTYRFESKFLTTLEHKGTLQR